MTFRRNFILYHSGDNYIHPERKLLEGWSINMKIHAATNDYCWRCQIRRQFGWGVESGHVPDCNCLKWVCFSLSTIGPHFLKDMMTNQIWKEIMASVWVCSIPSIKSDSPQKTHELGRVFNMSCFRCFNKFLNDLLQRSSQTLLASTPPVHNDRFSRVQHSPIGNCYVT